MYMVINNDRQSSGFTILEIILTVLMGAVLMYASATGTMQFQKSQLSAHRNIQRDFDYVVAQKYFFKMCAGAAYFAVGNGPVNGKYKTLVAYNSSGAEMARYADGGNARFPGVTALFEGVNRKGGSDKFNAVKVTFIASGSDAPDYSNTVLLKSNLDSDTWAYELDIGFGQKVRLTCCEQVRNAGNNDGYIFAGYILPSMQGYYQDGSSPMHLYLLKISSTGKYQWSKRYRFNYETTQYEPKMIRTVYSDGTMAVATGIAILGKVSPSYGSADFRISIMITDLSGNVNPVNGITPFFSYSIYPTWGTGSLNIRQAFDHGNQADGYIITGSAERYENNQFMDTQAVIIRTDNYGFSVWRKKLTFSNPTGGSGSIVKTNKPVDIVENIDSAGNSAGYTVLNLAATTINGAEQCQPILTRLSEDGNTIVSSHFYRNSSVKAKQSGGLIAGLSPSGQQDGSYSMAFTHVDQSTLISTEGIIKTAVNGKDVSWAKRYPQAQRGEPTYGENVISKSADGGYFFDCFRWYFGLVIAPTVGSGADNSGNPTWLQTTDILDSGPLGIAQNREDINPASGRAGYFGHGAFYSGATTCFGSMFVYRCNTSLHCPEWIRPLSRITTPPDDVMIMYPPGFNTYDSVTVTSDVVDYTPDIYS